MEVIVNHAHGQEIALERAKNMMNKLLEKYGPQVKNLQENWNGNTGTYSCSYNGMSLSGSIQVNDNNVVVNGKLPFFALPLSVMVENAIRSNVENALK